MERVAGTAGTTTGLELERRRLVVVPAILALNFGVWLVWRFGGTWRPDVLGFMSEHFVVSLETVEAGRFWTLLTAAFSHIQGMHLLINMLVLKSFGDPLERAWGPGRFTTFYLCAAVAASAVHASLSYFGWPDVPAVGASGAIAGVLICFSFLYPRRLLLFLLIVPVPAWLAAMLFVGLDLWGLVEQRAGHGLPIGHGAHLGGALFGVLWSLLDRGLGNDLEALEEEALLQHELEQRRRMAPVVRRIQREVADALRQAELDQARDAADHEARREQRGDRGREQHGRRAGHRQGRRPFP